MSQEATKNLGRAGVPAKPRDSLRVEFCGATQSGSPPSSQSRNYRNFVDATQSKKLYLVLVALICQTNLKPFEHSIFDQGPTKSLRFLNRRKRGLPGRKHPKSPRSCTAEHCRAATRTPTPAQRSPLQRLGAPRNSPSGAFRSKFRKARPCRARGLQRDPRAPGGLACVSEKPVVP